MNCMECGTETTTGQRCRRCNGLAQRLLAAYECQDDDMALIAMVDDEHLSPARVGNRIGTTRPSAERRLAKARRRQELVHGRQDIDGDPCWCSDPEAGEHEERCVLLLGMTRKLTTMEAATP